MHKQNLHDGRFTLPVCAERTPARTEPVGLLRSVPVREVEKFACEIAGPHPQPEILQIARRIAEAQIDLHRVRAWRLQFMSDKLRPVHVTAVQNVPPALDLDANNSTTPGANDLTAFTEGGLAVAIADADVSIIDSDSPSLA